MKSTDVSLIQKIRHANNNSAGKKETNKKKQDKCSQRNTRAKFIKTLR